MAAYSYSDQQIESIVGKAKRFRVRFCVTALAVLVAASLAVFSFPAFHESVRGWLIPVLIALFVTPQLRSMWRWNTWPETMKTSLREEGVDISCNEICVSYAFGEKRRVSPCEVLRAEEPYLGGGLYLRTQNRYRYILIRRNLDGYAAIKRELSDLGVEMVKTSILPNWEEFVFVLLFVGTMICSSTVHSIQVLEANFIVSLLLAFTGLFVINSNPDAPKLRLARFGVFLPAIFSAIGLWSAWRG
jgi:hypothetical protein